MLMLLYTTKMVEAVEQNKAGKKDFLLCLVVLLNKKNRAVENNFLKELVFGVDYAEELYKQSRCISKT